MERSAPTPTTRLEHGRPVSMWYGIVAGPAAWVLVSALAWWIDSRACVGGEAAWGALSGGGVRALIIALVAAAFVAAAAGLAAAVRAWRHTTDRTSLTEAYGYSVPEYLAIAGVFISSVFVLAVFWTGLPAVLVRVCEGTR